MLERLQSDLKTSRAIAETGAQTKKDIGKAMKAMQAAHGGNYDGKMANQTIQTILE